MKSIQRLRTRHGAVVVGAALVVALSACAGGGGGSAQPAPVSTKLSDKPVTLTLAYTDDPPVKSLIAAFEKAHPTITIKDQQTPFGDYVKSIKLSMASSTPPDIAEYNPGAMRALVPAGLVYDLGPYEKAYGWSTSFPAASLDVLRSDKAAKQYGTGGLYAVPGALSVLGVYYNKSVVQKAGITSTPTSLDQLESDLAAVKKSGVTPFSLGGQGVGGFQLWNALDNSLASVGDYRDWVYGKPGSSIETAGAKAAASTIGDWVSKGYVPASANATADSDAQAAFTGGKSAYLITGNWAASAIGDAMGDNVGFFLFPQKSSGDDAVASGASVAFSISSKTKHPNEAAAFLDFMRSADAAKVQVQTGFMPVDSSASVDVTGVKSDIAAAFKKVVDANGIVPFPDFASPDMIDQLTSGVQGLLSDQTTPDQYLSALQKSWSSYHA
jgi:raffinose/stachyose/melibiose transport system substrate-binding protein